MSTTEKEVIELCEKLVAIIKDGEYGLITWHEARYQLAKALHDKLEEVLSG